MPPVAGAVVRPVMGATANRDPGAYAAPQNDREHHVVAGARAVDRFRGGQAIGIVLHPDLATERQLQVALDRFAEQPGRARALAEPRSGFERAGDADADGAALRPSCRSSRSMSLGRSGEGSRGSRDGACPPADAANSRPSASSATPSILVPPQSIPISIESSPNPMIQKLPPASAYL